MANEIFGKHHMPTQGYIDQLFDYPDWEYDRYDQDFEQHIWVNNTNMFGYYELAISNKQASQRPHDGPQFEITFFDQSTGLGQIIFESDDLFLLNKAYYHHFGLADTIHRIRGIIADQWPSINSNKE